MALQAHVQGRMWRLTTGGILGVLVDGGNPASTKSLLLFSVVAMEMGFLKDGKAPDPLPTLSPSLPSNPPPQSIHKNASTPLWNNISVRQQDCRLQGGMLSRRTGASHLHGPQCVRETVIPFLLLPSLRTPRPLCRGRFPLRGPKWKPETGLVGVNWNIKLMSPLAETVQHS